MYNKDVDVKFTWDENKAKLNLRKHGVTFEAASEAFSDPHHIATQNYYVDGEQRMQIIGMTRGFVLVLVIFVDRSRAGSERIHIISARKASRQEERIYAQG